MRGKPSQLAQENPKLHRIWTNIKSRCKNPKNPRYADYGGRGIKICDEWNQSSEAFIKFAIEHNYRKGLEIDRIDNDGDYSPENCRFVTRKQNGRNKRNNVVIDGHCISEWAEILDIKKGTLFKRYYTTGSIFLERRNT